MRLKNPANSSIFFEKILWRKVSLKKNRIINRLINQEVDLYQLNGDSFNIEGFYKYKIKTKTFFIKVLKKSFSENEENSLKVMRWLKRKKFSVPKHFYSFEDKVDMEFYISIYEFLDGKFSNGTNDNLSRLGSCTAKLHNLLKVIPFSETIKKKTEHSILELSEKWETLQKKNHSVARKIKSIVPDISKFDFVKELTRDAQVIHGDLNYGNILFVKKKIYFFDFEDTFFSYFSPLVDISFLIQRFILIRERNIIKKSELLLKNFYESGGIAFIDKDQLYRILVSISIKSIMRLKTNNLERVVYNNELNKFLSLLKNSIKNKKFFQEVCSI